MWRIDVLNILLLYSKSQGYGSGNVNIHINIQKTLVLGKDDNGPMNSMLSRSKGDVDLINVL